MGSFTTGLDTENPPDQNIRKEYLDNAIQATKSGDIRAALEMLYLGHILDGLYRRLRKKWGKLSEDEIHESLAQAIVQLIEKVIEGEEVSKPVSYLIKVSDGIAYNIWKGNEQYSEKEIDKLSLVEKNQNNTSNAINYDEAMKKALSIAKNFLPKLGQENVQLVMEYILDALERGVEDITNQEIGDALNLSPDVVRQSKTRGWQRLERIAKENGYHLNMRFLKDDEKENEGDSDE